MSQRFQRCDKIFPCQIVNLTRSEWPTDANHATGVKSNQHWRKFRHKETFLGKWERISVKKSGPRGHRRSSACALLERTGSRTEKVICNGRFAYIVQCIVQLFLKDSLCYFKESFKVRFIIIHNSQWDIQVNNINLFREMEIRYEIQGWLQGMRGRRLMLARKHILTILNILKMFEKCTYMNIWQCWWSWKFLNISNEHLWTSDYLEYMIICNEHLDNLGQSWTSWQSWA